MNGRNQYTIMYIESSSLDPSCYVVDLPNAKNCDVLRQRKVLHVLLPYTTQTGADRPTLQLYHRTLLRRESNESSRSFSPLKSFFLSSRRLPILYSSFTFIFLRNNNEQAPLTSKLLSTEHTLNHHERNLRKDESSLNHERAAVHQRRRHW